jgi:hypothetical protein
MTVLKNLLISPNLCREEFQNSIVTQNYYDIFFSLLF